MLAVSKDTTLLRSRLTNPKWNAVQRNRKESCLRFPLGSWIERLSFLVLGLVFDFSEKRRGVVQADIAGKVWEHRREIMNRHRNIHRREAESTDFRPSALFPFLSPSASPPQRSPSFTCPMMARRGPTINSLLQALNSSPETLDNISYVSDFIEFGFQFVYLA